MFLLSLKFVEKRSILSIDVLVTKRENPAAEGRDQYGVDPFSDVKNDSTPN